MARKMRLDFIETRIEKAQNQVIKTKGAYYKALEHLHILLDKKKVIQQKTLIKAIAESEKTYEEILNFIAG